MLLSNRKVQEICRGIEMFDQGYRKSDGTYAPYRDVNVKTRVTLAKNLALLFDDYQAFQNAQRARLFVEELTEDGNIKDLTRRGIVENELREALLEEKDYPLKQIPEASLPLQDMPPTLIKMLLPMIETED